MIQLDKTNLLDYNENAKRNTCRSESIMTIKDMKIGESAIVTKVGGKGALRQHFLDMGMIPGTEVTLVKFAPMGDPMELRLHGYELTLRLDDAAKIDIEPLSSDEGTADDGQGRTHKKKVAHPGLGESGGEFLVVFIGVGLEDGVSKLSHFDVVLAKKPDISKD